MELEGDGYLFDRGEKRTFASPEHGPVEKVIQGRLFAPAKLEKETLMDGNTGHGGRAHQCGGLRRWREQFAG